MRTRPTIVLAVTALALAQNAMPQVAEEERLAVLTTQFLNAFERRDHSAAMAFWSLKAPGLSGAREELRRSLTPNNIRVTVFGPIRTTVTGDASRSRFDVDLAIVDSLSLVPVPGFGRGERIIDWAREQGEWKISRFFPAEQILAESLAAASTEAQRTTLLADQKPYFNQQLVRRLTRMGTVKAGSGDFDEGVRLNDLALGLADQLKDNAMAALVHQNRGNMHFDRSEYLLAMDRYQKALKLAEQEKDRRAEGSAHHGIARVHIWKYEFTKAIPELDNCLGIAKGSRDRWLESDCINSAGEAHRRMGELVRAKDEFSASLALAIALGDKNGEAIELENTANVHAMRGEYRNALQLYQRGLALDVEADSKEGQGRTWGNIGSSLEASGKYDEAMAALQRSIDFKRQLDDKLGIATTTLNIGIVHADRGNYQEAIRHYEDAYNMGIAIPDEGVQAQAANNIGSAFQSMGNYGTALIWYRISKTLEAKISDPVGEAMSDASIAQLQTLTGHFEEALKAFERAQVKFHAGGSKSDEAVTLVNMAEIQREKKLFPASERLYLSALTLQKQIPDFPGQVQSLQGLSVLNARRGRPESALKYALSARNLAVEKGISSGAALANLAAGDIQRSTRQYVDAKSSYSNALALAETAGVSDAFVGAQTGLGLIDIEQGNWESGADSCRKALERVERMRTLAVEPYYQMGLVSGNMTPYHCLIAAEVGRKHEDEAFRVAEMSRSRALMESLGRRRAGSEIGLQAAERERLAGYEATEASIYESLRKTPSPELVAAFDRAATEAAAYRRALYATYPDLAARRGEVPPVRPVDLAPLLTDDKTAILEYVIGERNSWVFVVRRGADSIPVLKVHTLSITAKGLEVLVKPFLDRIGKAIPDNPEAIQLYRALLGPALRDLAGVKTLAIVPDQSMWQIPFAALQPDSEKYLVQFYATAYAPSLAALLSMNRSSAERRKATADDSILIVANPSLGPQHSVTLGLRGSFSELPDANREALEIRKLFSAPFPLVGPAATERDVRQSMGDKRFIHFATHGFLDSIDPMSSGIVLAHPPQAGQDGILDAREISNMELRADLVVISACRSGEGDIVGGEGVVGLSWALMAAGAPSSIVAKWSVDDPASAVLMPLLYRNLLNKETPRSKAEALRRAQLSLLAKHSKNSKASKYANPYYWAPFVLMGDWR